MAEPKPIASLSSTLLARKGHAKPAMRPQNYSFSHTESGLGHQAEVHDDLGWNDMGHYEPEAPPSEPTPIHVQAVPQPIEPPVVVAQQEQLAKEFSPVAKLSASPAIPQSTKKPSRAAPGSKGKSAFTLRLDGDRHLRLRLVCAVRHRSAQQIVTQALDEFLERQSDVDRFAGKH